MEEYIVFVRDQPLFSLSDGPSLPAMTYNNNPIMKENPLASAYECTILSLPTTAPTPSSLLSLYSSLPPSTHPSSPFHQYLLLCQLTRYLHHHKSEQLALNIPQLLSGITHDFQHSNQWELFHYEIWKHETSDVEIKKLCKYYTLFSEWVNHYEERISRPENQEKCFVEVERFVRQYTEGYFQRVVLVDQSYQDLKGVVKYQGFWQDEEEGDLGKELHQVPTQENYEGLLQLMQLLVYRADVYLDGQGLYENILAKTLAESLNYQNFVYRSLLFLIQSPKILHQKQMQITKLVMRFCTLSSNKQYILSLITKIVKFTSKAVKFACMSDYQSLSSILQLRQRFQSLQQLQNIQQFRELNLKKVQIPSIQFQPLANCSHPLSIPRGSSHTVYFQVLRPKSLILIQFYLDTNINVSISYQGDLWTHSNKSTYYNEQKCTSRSLQIQVNDCGLHSVTFDNGYSWINSKRVKFDVSVYRPVQGQNSQFAVLWGNGEYVAWRGYHVGEVLTEEQNQYFTRWQQYKPQHIDLLMKSGKVFYRGKVYTPEQLLPLALPPLLTYVLQDPSPQAYTPLIAQLLDQNPALACINPL